MPLGHRQQRAYVYTVNIYRCPQQNETQGALKGDTSAYYQLVYADVPCFLESRPEDDEPGQLGRSKELTVFTNDVFTFFIGLELYDADMLEMVSAPNPYYTLIGKWWAAHGNTRTFAYRSNSQSMYFKRCEPPELA